ncbi:MAG: radical SAM family heme chaperone HemW [Rickettsiales bacterium]
MFPLSLYLHWPFCVSKCPYCDFNSHVRDAIDLRAFRDAYLLELSHYAPLMKKRGVHTIFFGGGTPSLMPPELTEEIIRCVSPYLSSDAEVTMEANPSSTERAKLRAFREAGVNRLSLGAQSFNDAELRFLGRAHDAKAGRLAVDAAREEFGERFSFDLIYCLPGQSREEWARALEAALRFAPSHLSLYQLVIETGTPFYYAVKRGDFSPHDDDAQADFYDDTGERMRAAGFVDYETSNYARPGYESRHNLQYWRYRDYIGVGPGAHGRFVGDDGRRIATVTVHHPEKWAEVAKKNGVGTQRVRYVSPEEALSEALLTGMRLKEGASLAHVSSVAGVDVDAYWTEEFLSPFVRADLLERGQGRLRCGRAGRLAHTGVVAALCDAVAPFYRRTA